MAKIITDNRIIRTLNMLHYAKTQAKKIADELNSDKHPHNWIDKSTAIEFYIISFGQLIYILSETLKKLYKNKHAKIGKIFKIKEIDDWYLFAQKVKHNNKPPIRHQNITITLPRDKNKLGKTTVKTFHNFTFKSGKTEISIKNMEEKMSEIHKLLLTKIENFYTHKDSPARQSL